MRYVARDEAGNILAVYTEPQPGVDEALPVDSPELLSFVLGQDAEMALRAYMASTDSDLLRIIEDLINVLIDRNVVMLSDFPTGAQKKLLRRATIRDKLQSFKA